MRNYYIFLDYDGVMWSLDLLKKEGFKSLINSLIKYNAGKENIIALNKLILRLKREYNPIIVVTSERRRRVNQIKKGLISGGLVECEFDYTALKKFNLKGGLVNQYLLNKKEDKNFLIIDDFLLPYRMFNKDKIIKTSLFKGGLTQDLVDKYLNTNEI